MKKRIMSLLIVFTMILSIFSGVVFFDVSAGEATLTSTPLDYQFTDRELRTVWKSETDEAGKVAGIKSITKSNVNGDYAWQVLHDSIPVSGASAFASVTASGGTLPFLEKPELINEKNIFGDIDITNKPYLTVRGHGYNTASMEHVLYLGSTKKNVLFKTEKTKGYAQADNGKNGWYDAYVRFDLSGLKAIEGSEKPGAPLSDYIGDIDYVILSYTTGWFVEWLCGDQIKMRMLEWSVESYVNTDELRDLILLARKNGVDTDTLDQAVMVYADQKNTDQSLVDDVTALLKSELDNLLFDGEGYSIPGFDQYTAEQLAQANTGDVNLNKEDGKTIISTAGEYGEVNNFYIDNAGSYMPIGNSFFGTIDISNKTGISFKVEGYNGDLGISLIDENGNTEHLTMLSNDDGVYVFDLSDKAMAIDQYKMLSLAVKGHATFSVTDWKLLAKVDTLALYNSIKLVQKYGAENIGLGKAKLDEALAIYADSDSTQEAVDAINAELAAAVSGYDYERITAYEELNELLNIADGLGFFDDDSTEEYEVAFNADSVYSNSDSTTADYVRQVRIMKGYIAAATIEGTVGEALKDILINKWEYNYTEKSFAKMLELVDEIFYGDLSENEMESKLAEAISVLELINVATYTISGVSKWEDYDIEDLLLANSASIAENMGDGIHYSDDMFYMSEENGIKYFNMEAIADKKCMGYKNFDAIGSLAGSPGGAFPFKDFFGDMSDYDGIRFKVKVDGEVESFNFRISNCSATDGIHMEAKVLNVPAGAIGEDGYITLPFEIFVNETWGSPLMKVLDKAIVMILEANNVTEGTVVSFGDFHGYNKFTFGFPTLSGIENGARYPIDADIPVRAEFNDGEVTLNGAKYASGTPVTEVGEYLLVHSFNGREKRYSFEVFDNTPIPVISGVEDGEVYDLNNISGVAPSWDCGTATLNGAEFAAGSVVGTVGKYTLVVTNGSKSTTVSFEITDSRVAINNVGVKIENYFLDANGATIGLVDGNGGISVQGSCFADSYENAKNNTGFDGNIQPEVEYWALISVAANDGYKFADLHKEDVNIVGAEYEEVIVEYNAESDSYEIYIRLKALEKRTPVTEVTVNVENYNAGTGSMIMLFRVEAEGANKNGESLYASYQDFEKDKAFEGTLEEGKSYWGIFYLEAKDGYTITEVTAENIKFKGVEPLQVSIIDRIETYGHIAVLFELPVIPRKVSGIEVTIDGFTYGNNVGNSWYSTSTEGVRLSGAKYYLSKEDALSGSNKFEDAFIDGVEYWLTINYEANEGYELAEDFIVTLIGGEANEITIFDGYILFGLNKLTAPKITINSGSFTLEGYELGASIGDIAPSLETDGIVPENVMIFEDLAMDPIFSGNFASGIEYSIVFVVRAAEGYEIAEDAIFTLVGAEAVGYRLEITEDGTCYVTFTLKAFEETVKKGDFDGDGKISVADALAALRIAAKMAEETAESLKLGDIDGDGKITVSDSLAILRVAAKMADTL